MNGKAGINDDDARTALGHNLPKRRYVCVRKRISAIRYFSDSFGNVKPFKGKCAAVFDRTSCGMTRLDVTIDHPRVTVGNDAAVFGDDRTRPLQLPQSLE